MHNIGGEADDPGGPTDVPQPDMLTQMIQEFVIEQDDVQAGLTWLFEFFARLGKSQHWELEDREAERLAKPYTKLLNVAWSEIARMLPGALSGWLERTPGLMGAIVASGFIVVPRVKLQMAISRERARVPLVSQPPQQRPSPQPVSAASMVQEA